MDSGSSFLFTELVPIRKVEGKTRNFSVVVDINLDDH
jgi:hypothetical protein